VPKTNKKEVDISKFRIKSEMVCWRNQEVCKYQKRRICNGENAYACSYKLGDDVRDIECHLIVKNR